MKIGRAFLILTALAFLIVIAGLIYLFTNLNALVEAVIENEGGKVTQTAVEVNGVDIQLGEGAAAIKKLTIANPGGFSTPLAFSLENISAQINLKSVTETPKVIENISIDGPALFYEINKDGKGNFNVLKDNLTAGQGPASSQPAESPQSGQAPKIAIRHFELKNATMQALIVPLKNKQYDIKLPPIEFRNLGGKNGATPDALAREILNRLLERGRTAARKKGLEQYLKSGAKEKLEAKKQELKDKTQKLLDKEKDNIKNQLNDLMQ